MARRIARFGEGWIPWGDAASGIVDAIDAMAGLVESEVGTLDGVQIASNLRRVTTPSGEVDLDATMLPPPATSSPQPLPRSDR
ncbi:MAG: hypothetical protein JST64_00200 [Actinobacteria bacterium]|nr:hypothetical protein [Actinomycetota bacterium]